VAHSRPPAIPVAWSIYSSPVSKNRLSISAAPRASAAISTRRAIAISPPGA
jgi:hypothetical protein